ncbi:uncharacterized protein BDV17DRAFT_56919 [Aspergillus undulatus]|uniref:uncharacterized protein n=1 Tax=Aspergillus undulatus TaxID=1810928 RepID=UPI003CCD501A
MVTLEQAIDQVSAYNKRSATSNGHWDPDQWVCPASLRAFHWVIVGRLAWFSSLTHLSRLTLLRNYLHNRKPQRQWRVSLICAMIIVLLTAIGSTLDYGGWKNYTLRNSGTQKRLAWSPTDHGICHSSAREPLVNDIGPWSTFSMILLVGLESVFRFVKLHRRVSLYIVENTSISAIGHECCYGHHIGGEVSLEGHDEHWGVFLIIPHQRYFSSCVSLRTTRSQRFSRYWYFFTFSARILWRNILIRRAGILAHRQLRGGPLKHPV